MQKHHKFKVKITKSTYVCVIKKNKKKKPVNK